MTAVRSINFLLLLILISCKQNAINNNEKAIIGDWKFIKEIQKKGGHAAPEPQLIEFVGGYSFLSDGVCEKKPGYFKRIKGNEPQDGKTLFLGTTTKYKIEDDSLKIYNLYSCTWTSLKIASINIDTMILRNNDSNFVKYAKSNYQIDDKEHFDKIIISASGCYGACPINDISINEKGEAIYFGDEYNTVNGCFKSKLSPTIFSKLENDFKKANIKKLRDHYSGMWSDDETISVTFVKSNKVFKTVVDYGRQSPAEFYWAYTSARYLYQQIPLDTISIHLNYFPFKYSLFESGGKVCELSQSEGFYLWTLLMASNKTNKHFTEKYFIRNVRLKEREIKTDGQLFKFTDDDGVTRTYDLGFNFIITNGFDKKFRIKNQYD